MYLIFLWPCFSVLLPASIAVIVCFQQTKTQHPLHIINVFFWITWSEGLRSKNASLLKTKSTESCNRIQFFGNIQLYSVHPSFSDQSGLVLAAYWVEVGWYPSTNPHCASVCPSFVGQICTIWGILVKLVICVVPGHWKIKILNLLFYVSISHPRRKK